MNDPSDIDDLVGEGGLLTPRQMERFKAVWAEGQLTFESAFIAPMGGPQVEAARRLFPEDEHGRQAFHRAVYHVREALAASRIDQEEPDLVEAMGPRFYDAVAHMLRRGWAWRSVIPRKGPEGAPREVLVEAVKRLTKDMEHAVATCHQGGCDPEDGCPLCDDFRWLRGKGLV